MRISTQQVLLDSLSAIFETRQQLRAYELMDGTRGVRDIGASVGVGKSTVFDWCRKWKEKYHIVEKLVDSGNYRKVYSLSDLLVRHGADASDPANRKIDADANNSAQPANSDSTHVRPQLSKHNSKKANNG